MNREKFLKKRLYIYFLKMWTELSTYLNQAKVSKTNVILQNGSIKNKQYVLSLATTGREKYGNSN